MNFNQIMTIFSMLPGIIGMVHQVETLIPGQGKGKEKLDLVLNTVSAAAGSIPSVSVALAGHDLEGTVKAVAGATVTSLKAAGVFTSGAQ